MPTNDFLPFGSAVGANVMAQAEYAALAARSNGFTAGTAVSKQLNKAWRQSSVMSSVLAQFIADQSGNDVLDDGNLTAIQTNLGLAIKAAIASGIPYATQTEAEAGTSTTKAMSPLRVFQAIAKVVTQATEAAFGWAKIASQVQTNAGTDDATIVTPLKLKTWFTATFSQATVAVAGLVKIATSTLIAAGTDDSTCVTPLGLKGAYGLGDSVLVTDLNNAAIGFFYAAPGAANAPSSGILHGETRGGSGTSTKYQTATDSVSGTVFKRVFSSSTWGAWSSVVDSISQLGSLSQSWQVVARTVNTTYTNDTGRPIFVSAYLVNATNANGYFQVNGVNAATLVKSTSAPIGSLISIIVPVSATYGTVAASAVTAWSELR